MPIGFILKMSTEFNETDINLIKNTLLHPALMPHVLHLLTTRGKEFYLVPRITTDWLILVAWPQEIRTTNVPFYNPDIILLLGGNIHLQFETQDNFNHNCSSTLPYFNRIQHQIHLHAVHIKLTKY